MAPELRWHPWRILRTQHPNVEVSCQHRLPDHLMGLQRGVRIWLCKTLTQVERRCTLTHELVHQERGLVVDPAAAAREELVVDEIAARRLITLPALIDGLRWTRQPCELADHLWVDEPTLKTRLNTLDPIEVTEIEHALNGDWLWIP